MNLYGVPAELLLAFCGNPRSVAALRLTCAKFYEKIPHVRKAFTKLNDLTWSSGFWIIQARIGEKTTDVLYVQHRFLIEPTECELKDALCNRTVRPAKLTSWYNGDFVWNYKGTITFMLYTEGFHLLEDPANIYYFNCLHNAGDKKAINVFNSPAADEDNAVVSFEHDIPCANMTLRVIKTSLTKSAEYAGCEHDCKVYVRVRV